MPSTLITIHLPDICEFLICRFLDQFPRIVCLTDSMFLAAITKNFSDLTQVIFAHISLIMQVSLVSGQISSVE